MNDNKGFGKCYDIIKKVFTEHATFNKAMLEAIKSHF